MGGASPCNIPACKEPTNAAPSRQMHAPLLVESYMTCIKVCWRDSGRKKSAMTTSLICTGRDCIRSASRLNPNIVFLKYCCIKSKLFGNVHSKSYSACARVASDWGKEKKKNPALTKSLDGPDRLATLVVLAPGCCEVQRYKCGTALHKMLYSFQPSL